MSQPVSGGFWETLSGFGDSALEAVGENIGGLVSGAVDYQTQKWAEKSGNPQVQKEAEPVKGKSVTGKPIVVSQEGGLGGFSTSQIAMVAGGIGILAVVLIATRG